MRLQAKWSSPSNIALVKYWGKRLHQIPVNPSLSFTLKHAVTHTSIEIVNLGQKSLEVDFFFEDKPQDKFKEKILKFLVSVQDHFPWLKEAKLLIHSKNTFPHSSGIASSASSMSALNLCLISLDQMITKKELSEGELLKKASYYSRLASGSACRSLYPFMASWGQLNSIKDSSDEFATPLAPTQVHEVFHHFCDSIIIVDSAEKSVSSRAGHALMEQHPFKDARIETALLNMEKLLTALKNGDLELFMEIVEAEALMLHALMMTSSPSYLLLKPESLFVIEKVRSFREAQKVPVCFTIDAGPNIHLLYPKSYEDKVRAFIKAELGVMKVLFDEVGSGPLGF